MPDDLIIPEELAKYSAEILTGLETARRRRTEFEFMENGSRCRPPVVVVQPIQFPELPKQKSAVNAAAEQLIRFWPLMALAAIKSNKGGSFVIWTLAKNLDKQGLGAIPLENLLNLSKDLVIHPKRLKRWLAAARHSGLIHDRCCGDGMIVLASHAAAAVTFGCSYAGNRAAGVKAGLLVAGGWRSHVFAAYESTHGGHQISRKKQEEICGVPISTQRRYDKLAGVIREKHYAESGRSADHLDGVIDFENRAAPFEYWNARRRRKEISWRLPDSRSAISAESLQRGRSRKINRKIQRIIGPSRDGSLILKRAVSFEEGGVVSCRLFNRTLKQAKAAERKISRSDKKPPREIYLYMRKAKDASIWDVLPQNAGVMA